MSQRIFFSALLILWLASRASADGGDDFANNLASDLGPIIALFGERVVMQFMSQAMGIADCILLAVAPIGAITTVVSAIRVAGPAWLKSFIGRARENLAAAEVEVMSSTSTETCELWNGNSVVRCPGSADIYQFICLIPKNKGVSIPAPKIFDVGCKKLKSGAQQKTKKNINSGSADGLQSNGQATEQGEEETKLLKETRKTGLPYIRQSFRSNISLMSDELKRVFHPNAKRIPHSDPENAQNTKSKEGMEIIVVEDTDGSAPNLLLNSHDRVGRGEIYVAAAIGLILQLGAVVYFGIITFYKPTQDIFLKDGKRVVKYAFPCAAVGTLLLVLGLFICSWVVGESTKETCYEAKNHQVFIVWLQKDHTVSDQVFKPFAVYPTSEREYITLSRRNIKNRPNEIGELIDIINDRLFKGSRMAKLFNSYFKREVEMGDKNGRRPLYWPLEAITFIGALISFIGFISQFIGMRGLNWTASIVQLGITIVVTILRVIVRRGLGKPPAHTSLNPKFELDWFVLSFGNLATAPWYKPRDSDIQNYDSTETSSKWEICTGGELTNLSLKKKGLDLEHSESSKISEPHKIMLIRKELGQFSKWKSSLNEEALHLSKAIKAVADTLLSGQPKGSYEWSIPAIYTPNSSTEPVRDNIYITIVKDENDKWLVDETEIEAILSLWLYSTSSASTSSTSSTLSTKHAKLKRLRSLRVYGASDSETRLIRDLEWWMRENTAKISKYPEAYVTRLTRKESDCMVMGFRSENEGLKAPTGTPAQHTTMKEYLALEFQDEQQRLLSRHMFFSFMRAVAKMPGVNIESASSINSLAPNMTSKEWKQMKLKNEVISDLAKSLEKIGFGSLSDIYIDLIIPLSLEHKLTNVKNIIVDIAKKAHEHERSLQWKKLVDTCLTLLNLALEFDIEKESSGPLAIAICLGFIYRLHHEASLQDSERRIEEEFTTQFKELRDRFTNEKIQGLVYFPATLLDEPSFSAVSLSTLAGPINSSTEPFPISFQISDEVLEVVKESQSDQENQLKRKLHIEDFMLETLERTDAFGWSLLHYAASLTLDSINIDSKWKPTDEFLNSRDLLGWTFLHHACFFGNQELVSVLLDHGALIEIAGLDGITPMHCAVQSGNADIIQRLMHVLDTRHKTNTRRSERYVDRNERHPIHWAAVEGNVEMVRLMKRDIDLPDRFGWTPLHLAGIYGHEELLEYITKNYAAATLDIDAGDNNFRTPLHLAVESKRTAAVQILVDADAKVNTVAKDGSAPLHVAVKQREILSMLLEHGADVEAIDMDGRTPLYLSVEDGEIETMNMLIDKGANVHLAARDGRTPLHVAVSRGQDGLEVAKILLQAGADANTRAQDGATVLHIAAQSGSLFDILNLLGGVELELDAIDEYGQTALLIAVYKREWPAARLLLERGARVNADRKNGYTPLLGAVMEENNDVSQELLNMGVNVNDTDEDGYSALHFAVLRGNSTIASLLLEAGANIDAVARLWNETPLHMAIRKRHTEIVHILLKKGADTTVLNSFDFSPLQDALYRGNLSMVHILIEHDKSSATKAALQQNKEGDTPLHTLAACTEDEDTICEMLDELLSIGSDIDINAKNNQERTPLDIALFIQTTNHRTFIAKLLKAGAETGSELLKHILKEWMDEGLGFWASKDDGLEIWSSYFTRNGNFPIA